MSAESKTDDYGNGKRNLVFGSRKSKLALWQTRHVAEALVTAHPDVEYSVVEISTKGDQQLEQPLPEIGGKGLFTQELDRFLEQGQIDIAVHSLKDLPTEPTPNISVIPVLTREDPRDVLVTQSGCGLSELPAGSIVGTSSYRRQAQLLAIRSDLEIRSIRGNVPTRISKVRDGQYDAIVLAAAGVIRVGQTDAISEWLSLDQMLPAAGQAAIAATCRSDDVPTNAIVKTLCDTRTVQQVAAERKFLAAMGGGCSAPIAVHARFLPADSNQMALKGRVAAIDGSKMITRELVGNDHQELAIQLAETVLVEGGKLIMDSLKTN